MSLTIYVFATKAEEEKEEIIEPEEEPSKPKVIEMCISVYWK